MKLNLSLVIMPFFDELKEKTSILIIRKYQFICNHNTKKRFFFKNIKYKRVKKYNITSHIKPFDRICPT